MEVFVTKVNGFQFLVIVTKDLVLDIAGSYILCYLLMFAKKCVCFAIFVLILIFISFDCNKLIINVFECMVFLYGNKNLFHFSIHFVILKSCNCKFYSLRSQETFHPQLIFIHYILNTFLFISIIKFTTFVYSYFFGLGLVLSKFFWKSFLGLCLFFERKNPCIFTNSINNT